MSIIIPEETGDHTVNAVDISEDGIYGRLYTSAISPGRYGILVLGGSGGGIDWSDKIARCLAENGYTALALAYFNYAGLPVGLQQIPLEYFEKAIDWMAKQEDIDTEHLTIIGGSRGGELALLLGSLFPKIKAVVGYAASSVRWGANGSFSSMNKAAWTYSGKNLPHMKMGFSFNSIREKIKLVKCLIRRKNYQAKPLLVSALQNKKIVDRSIIPVEKINGPILLFSGMDDNLFPAPAMSEMIIKRLQEKHHPHYYSHFCLKGAGHSIKAPGLEPKEYPNELIHMLTGLKCDLGGSEKENAIASEKAWKMLLWFLSNIVYKKNKKR